MSSTLTTLQGYVTDALGAADTVSTSLATRGINLGQLLAALLFKPPELQTSGNVTVSAAGTSVSLSTLTGLHSVITVYNTTGSCPCHMVTREKWDLIIPTFTGTVYVRFYNRLGSTLYVNAPTGDNVLLVKYFKLPTTLTAGGQTLDFDNYDYFITEVATRYAWACKEEPDSSKVFADLMAEYTQAYSVGGKLREEVQEALKSGYNV